MTALLCELGSMTAFWFREAGVAMQFLAPYLFFAAAVVGTISLGLAAAVSRTRRQRPPDGILVFSLVVGAAPILAMLVQWAIS